MSHAHRPWGYQPPEEGHSPDWKLHPQTEAIRSGTERSGFGETSEAMYLTSGFTYDNAEQAEHGLEHPSDLLRDLDQALNS
jgi:O-succinylhomoserine sulfhydrylase